MEDSKDEEDSSKATFCVVDLYSLIAARHCDVPDVLEVHGSSSSGLKLEATCISKTLATLHTYRCNSQRTELTLIINHCDSLKPGTFL
jgi:hypothetical protein